MNTTITPTKKAATPEKAHQQRTETLHRFLLICGIVSSVWYVVINIIVPPFFPGYNVADQTVSELSAIGAPTRRLWMLLAWPYTLLVLAFAWGVWQSGASNRALRIAGSLLLVYGALGVLWPFAPMHLREALAAGKATWSDTAHISLGAVTEVLYLVALGFAAAALGKAFRLYSFITLAVVFVFGLLTFLAAPGVAKNQPTPLLGIWERINIGVFLLWVIVLAVLLMKSNDPGKAVPAKTQN